MTPEDYYANAPSLIEVTFEYEKKSSYYALDLPWITVERVALAGIYDALGDLEEDDLKDTTVSFWKPTRLGWELKWRLEGEEFLKRRVLKEIKKRTRRKQT
jgi:hypothetical protein